jgi:hypothetical protein
MKIPNCPLRREFALPGYCELCGRFCRKREGHHLWRCTPELTIRINLISLGSSRLYGCQCHREIHDGNLPASRVLLVVANREKCRVGEIIEVMHWMRRWVKPTEGQLARALEELSPPARLIAMKELDEAKVKRRLTVIDVMAE